MDRDNPEELLSRSDDRPVPQVRMHEAGRPEEEREPRPSPTDEILGTLEQIEATLADVRRTLEKTDREQRYQEFSAGRLIGSVLQALVVGLLVWATSDWVFDAAREGLITKLAFAAVLQLTALTAFVLGRDVP